MPRQEEPKRLRIYIHLIFNFIPTFLIYLLNIIIIIKVLPIMLNERIKPTGSIPLQQQIKFNSNMLIQIHFLTPYLSV